jgi:hypothetical protein
MTYAVFVVMIAGRVIVLDKLLCKESLYSFVGTARISSVEGDACLFHSHLCTTANTAADKHICLNTFQKSCQSAVP